MPVSVSGPHWAHTATEGWGWQISWHCSGGKKITVGASKLSGDKEAARRVADQVAQRVREADIPCDTADFLEYRNELITQEVEQVTSGPTGGAHAPRTSGPSGSGSTVATVEAVPAISNAPLDEADEAGSIALIETAKERTTETMQSESPALAASAPLACPAESTLPASCAAAASSTAAEEISMSSAASECWLDAAGARAVVESAKKNAAAKLPGRVSELPVYSALRAALEENSDEDVEGLDTYDGTLHAFTEELEERDLAAPTSLANTYTYAGVLQTTVLHGAQSCDQPGYSDLQSVLTVEPRWAALIFATEGPPVTASQGVAWTGVKTQEVRSASTIIRGRIGVAVSAAPSLIVGSVNLDDEEELTRDEIAERQEHTCIPPAELEAYIKGGRGYVWHLSKPFLFVDPIPQVTDGQVWKGRPNEHEQMLVRLATRRLTGTSEDDIRALQQLFEVYQNRQARPEHKGARQLSKRLKAATNPLPKRNAQLGPKKAHAAKVLHELQRRPFMRAPDTKRTRTSHREASCSEESQEDVSQNPMDTAAQVSTASAMQRLE